MSLPHFLQRLLQAAKGRNPLPRRLVLEYLEDRTLLTILTQGLPDWIEQGPGPNINGQVENVTPNNPVAGAINAIAPDPLNGDILYVATVNGGIWRTNNATAVSPSWIPLTDRFPSLSFGDIALDPLDNNTLYAGTARTSSSGGDGGPLNGLLKTTDGGSTWTMLGQSTFSGQSIHKVLPTVQSALQPTVLLVASTNGLYRSADGGVNWARILASSGLPSGNVTALIGSSGSSPESNNYYAAISGQGIFRSNNGGLNWSSIRSNIPLSVVSGSFQIELAAHHNFTLGTDAVYLVLFGSNAAADALFRSTNQGDSWTAMDFPGQTEPVRGVPTFIPVGSYRSGFVADQNDPNLVYIAGGAQPGPFPNSLGARNFTDRVFRGDASQSLGSQWTSVTNNGANGTSPHADNRDLKFDALGNLLSASDGGIYRLLNPNLSSRRWVSVIGDIRPTEFYSVAYDAVNHTLLGGTQDTGSPEQTGADSFTWRDTTQGDGGVTATDNVTLSGRSIHYVSAQTLINFQRRVLNNANHLVSDTGIKLVVAGTGGKNLFDVEGKNPNGSTIQFIQPYVLNKVDPRRMIIGTDFLYESTDMGDDITSVGGVVNLGGGSFRPSNPVGRVRGIVYGGFEGTLSNPEVLWVGAASQLRLRTSGSGLPAVVTTYPGSAVVAIQTNPFNWREAYVLDDARRVWRTTDAGATRSWTNLTGNLTNLVKDLRTIEVVGNFLPANLAILVGGLGGVYRAVNPGRTATWSRFGRFGSNAVVNDLHYNAADNVLIAGTLGRGAWKVANATDTLFQSAILTVQGTPGNDDIRLARDANVPGLLQVFVNSVGPVFTVEAAALQQVIVDPLGGNDTVNIEDTFSNVPATVTLSDGTTEVDISASAHSLGHIQGGVSVNGGSGPATLNVFDQAASGSLTYSLTDNSVSRASSAAISYAGIGRVNVNGSGGSNTYNITGTEGGAGTITTLNTGTGSATVNVLATTGSLVISEQGSGNDTVMLSPTNKNLNDIQGVVTVNGNSGSSPMIVNDQNGPTRSWVVNSSDVAVSGGGPPDILYNSLSNLVLNASNGTNTYTVLNTASFFTTLNMGNGNDLVNVQATTGSLTVNAGAGNDTINVGSSGNTLDGIQGILTVTGQGGNSTLNVNDQGTSAGASYTIAAASLTRAGGPAINYGNVQNLVLNGGSGGNTINVQSTPAGTAVTVQSGSGSNGINLGNPNNLLDDSLGALNLNGQGPTNVNVNDQGSSTGHSYTLTASTLARDGIGLITFGGALSNIGVNAGSGNDTFTIVSEPAVSPVVFDGGAGTNTLRARDVANLWYISPTNAGQVNTIFFRNVQNLIGGNDTDTFTFLDGAGVSGSIDGGGGINKLDYSAYTSNVVVDLPLGTATGVGGGIASIQNLTGGAGSNILVGNGGNVLTGGTGRNLLIAGASASTLVGGGADNILIGGTTAYDMDLASLQAIMAYWAGPDDYNTRVANLTSGNGVPLLDATTVTGNAAGNRLLGGPGLDLFYGNLTLDTVMNWDPATETFVSV